MKALHCNDAPGRRAKPFVFRSTVIATIVLSTLINAQPDISNNVGPVKLFLNALLSFRLKEFFSFVLFPLLFSASTTTARS